MLICPHCGKKIYDKKKPRRHRRLPNGFGSITEIKGRHLSKPFLARVCTGKDENGKPILKSLRPVAYFASYNEAYMALIEYSQDPFDMVDEVTLKQLYERWIDEAKKGKAPDYEYQKEHTYSYLHEYYDRKFNTIRTRDIKRSIEEAYVLKKGVRHPASDNIKMSIKDLWNMLFDYALEHELVNRNYARAFDISTEIAQSIVENRKSHIIYSDEEIKTLWRHQDMPFVDLILIQCYSGWRPNELLSIKLEDVDIKEWSMTGGMKTKSGKDRHVPIHSAIRPFVEKWYKMSTAVGSQYLFCSGEGQKLSYSTYRRYFLEILEQLKLNPEHRLHDARKYFITVAKKSGIEENTIKRLVGHTIKDITEAVYTQRDIEWLRTDLEKIKAPVYK